MYSARRCLLQCVRLLPLPYGSGKPVTSAQLLETEMREDNP